jgi:hypothetical protein
MDDDDDDVSFLEDTKGALGKNPLATTPSVNQTKTTLIFALSKKTWFLQ